MALDLTLICDCCGRTSRPRVFYRWAPLGVLKIHGAVAPRWYVDGGSVYCGDCVPADKRARQDRAAHFHFASEEAASGA